MFVAFVGRLTDKPFNFCNCAVGQATNKRLFDEPNLQTANNHSATAVTYFTTAINHAATANHHFNTADDNLITAADKLTAAVKHFKAFNSYVKAADFHAATVANDCKAADGDSVQSSSAAVAFPVAASC